MYHNINMFILRNIKNKKEEIKEIKNKNIELKPLKSILKKVRFTE